MNILDGCVLSIIGTVWLFVPAYLEDVQVPFEFVGIVCLVEIPLVLGSAFFWCFVARNRLASRTSRVGDAEMGPLLFFAFMAYFWSLIDDAPVNFDSIFTWPEVTSGLPHTFLEIVLHALTLAFFYLAVRAALKGASLSRREKAKVLVLILASFWASYAQNTPLGWVQAVAVNNWYLLDAVEHVISVALFCLAIRECLTLSFQGPQRATGKERPPK